MTRLRKPIVSCENWSTSTSARTILPWVAQISHAARTGRVQPKNGQWTLSKGFDTFAPIGPWIETDLDPAQLEISTFLNGERRQHSNTRNLIFGCKTLVSYISQVMTLLPGDVIATGTPCGIGPMAIGDKIDVVIEGIGTLSNTVVAGS